MKVFDKLTDPEVPQLLIKGAVGILPTDTLYGIMASAKNAEAVERVYTLKQRQSEKACIILAHSIDHVLQWVQLTANAQEAIENYWPGPVSLVLSASPAAPSFLTRGGDSLAIRVPATPALRELLEQSGPLIAPSANPDSLAPALSVPEAQGYFADGVDFYVDTGEVRQSQPSTLLKVDNGTITVLRGQLPA